MKREQDYGYIVYIYDMEGIPMYAGCSEHGNIVVFSTKKNAQEALKFMKEDIWFDAQGEVVKIRVKPCFVQKTNVERAD